MRHELNSLKNALRTQQDNLGRVVKVWQDVADRFEVSDDAANFLALSARERLRGAAVLLEKTKHDLETAESALKELGRYKYRFLEVPQASPGAYRVTGGFTTFTSSI